MEFESRWLIQALTLAEKGSFSAASRHVGMTQSALSRSIQSLETAFGVPLFERNSRGVEPTAAGRVFLGRAKEMVAEIRDLEREMRVVASDSPAAVSLGLGPMAAQLLMKSALSRFLGDWPGVDVRMLVRSAPDLMRSLREGEIEFFVGEAAEATREANTNVAWLTKRPVTAYCRPQHPILDRGTLAGVSELMDYPLILMRALDDVMAWLRGQYARASAKASLIECESPFLSRDLVASTDVIGVGPLCFVRDAIDRGELSEIPIEVKPRLVRTGIVRLAERQLSAATESMIEAILQTDAELRTEDSLEA